MPKRPYIRNLKCIIVCSSEHVSGAGAENGAERARKWGERERSVSGLNRPLTLLTVSAAMVQRISRRSAFQWPTSVAGRTSARLIDVRGDMVVPQTRTQLGRWSVHVAAPVVWNALFLYTSVQHQSVEDLELG